MIDYRKEFDDKGYFTCVSILDDSEKKELLSKIDQIEKTINDSIAWAKTKDINRLYNIIAEDPAYIEVQPGDRIVKGFENFKKARKRVVQNFDISIRTEKIKKRIL